MKRVCSVILILAMLLALVPTAAFAADGTKAISIAATGGEKTITVEAQDAPETGGGQTTGKVLRQHRINAKNRIIQWVPNKNCE